MTLWEMLDRRSERRAALRASSRGLNPRLFANVVGAALIGGFLGALITLFFIPIPEKNEQLITYMIGQLSGFASGIIAYHYTLTAGAKELDAKRAETDAKHAETSAKLAAALPASQAGQALPDVILEPGQTAQAEVTRP